MVGAKDSLVVGDVREASGRASIAGRKSAPWMDLEKMDLIYPDGG